MSILNLHIDGDEHIIAEFVLLIDSLLEVGRKLGRIEYRMITHTPMDDDTIEVDADRPEIEYRRHGGNNALKQAIVLTLEVEEYIVKLYKEKGYSTIRIAREIKCHQFTVEKVLRKKGVMVSQRLSAEQKIEIVRLYVEEGWSSTKIGKHLKVSNRTVSNCLIQARAIKPMSRQESEMMGQKYRNLRLVHGTNEEFEGAVK